MVDRLNVVTECDPQVYLCIELPTGELLERRCLIRRPRARRYQVISSRAEHHVFFRERQIEKVASDPLLESLGHPFDILDVST